MTYELDDCGREFQVWFGPYETIDKYRDVTVQMVIKAPRGTMVLFEYIPHRQWRTEGNRSVTNKCQAIKAFMEEHRNDRTK